jgi:hypothetical protein
VTQCKDVPHDQYADSLHVQGIHTTQVLVIDHDPITQLGNCKGNPGVTPGLPLPIPSKYPYPCMGYGYSQVGVEGIAGQMGQKPVAGSDDR